MPNQIEPVSHLAHKIFNTGNRTTLIKGGAGVGKTVLALTLSYNKKTLLVNSDFSFSSAIVKQIRGSTENILVVNPLNTNHLKEIVTAYIRKELVDLVIIDSLALIGNEEETVYSYVMDIVKQTSIYGTKVVFTTPLRSRLNTRTKFPYGGKRIESCMDLILDVYVKRNQKGNIFSLCRITKSRKFINPNQIEYIIPLGGL